MNENIITKKYPVRIKIMGIGGAGGNAVNRMATAGIIDPSVEMIAVNTDLQALRESKAPIVIQIGPKTTKGQGSGGDPLVGKQAAEESADIIRDLLTNTDMLFLTCGMGKGTGTGATPVIARIAKELGVLTVAVVTKPFEFEGEKRLENAMAGITELKKYVDALLTIPNDKFLDKYNDLKFDEILYRIADDVLHKAVLSMWRVITQPGYVNVDYADARNVLKNAGEIIMSYGVERADTESCLKKAIKNAMDNPFVEFDIRKAKNLLVNICGKNLTGQDVHNAFEYLRNYMDKEAVTYIGYVNSDEFEDKVDVTIIASGLQIVERSKSKKALKTSSIKTELIGKETIEEKSENDLQIKSFRTGRLRVLK
jgi:cell division protein FtsZ